MTVNDLLLFATNTGALYLEHLRMARENAAPTVWRTFVKGRVLPAYRRELREPYEGLSTVEIEQVADRLAAHYARHVSEF